MAGPNSWTLPGNGLLGGVTLSFGPSRPGDPNSDPEPPWAKALRKAIERQPPGEAERLGPVVEQIRVSASPGNPLGRPAAALIDWLRQPLAPPAMTTKSDRAPQPAMLQHELVARDIGANIGKAAINHYADYLDPWTYEEQGRRVIDTPAAYTPNKVGKLPETEKPWWWPIVGGVDIGSNFAGLGAGAKAATVGGRAALAASKAAAAEAGMTGKLLDAIREGRLAELAGEGAGTETLASRSAGLYNPPLKPLRPFEADYPQGAPADATGRLTHDIEGRPLTARYVVGRRALAGPDETISPAELLSIGEGSVGARYTPVPARNLGREAGRLVVTTDRRSGAQDFDVLLNSDLSPTQLARVAAHETGHLIHRVAGAIPTNGLSRELDQVYNTLNTGKERSRNLTRPQHFRYSDSEAPRELMAEAIRAYMADPNYLKTVAPKTAARIREFVNANPQLSKVIQFNAVGGAVPFIQGSQQDARDRGDAP